MLHNSLLIRDFLKRRNANPVCIERRAVHRSVCRFPLPEDRTGVVALDGCWDFVVDDGVDGASELRRDAVDFLTKCGATIQPLSPRKVTVAVDGSIPPGAYHLAAADGSIAITASSTSGAWAGWLGVEKEITNRHQLCIGKSDVTFRPAWGVQISQAPFGSNFLVPDLSEEFLSDDAFLMLAHLGCNGMSIYGDWLLYVESNIFPELNHPDYERNVAMLKAATERAARYGISLFYVPVSPKLVSGHPVFQSHPQARGARLARGSRKGEGELHCLCSSSGESLAFVAETWGKLFEAVPLLGGLILIVGGESYYHCFMSPDKRNATDGTPVLAKTNCAACGKQKPEAVVSKLVGVTADAVHRSSPAAVVAAWPYSAARWSADPYQVDLINALPGGASFLSEIDKDQWIHKERAGYSKLIWDYSIDYTGPSDRIVEQAATCRGRGVPLLVKSETALGLEFIHVPYVPCLDRLAEKWANVRSLHPSGVLQSWMFFGSFGSRAEELGWWYCWRPELAADAILEHIAARDFGKASCHVRRAWVELSEATGHLPCIPPYFLGPFFLGPAHPLLPRAGAEVPEGFKGALYYKQEHEASLSSARIGEREPLVFNALPDYPNQWGFIADDLARSWEVFIAELERAMLASKLAHEAMGAAIDCLGALAPDHRRNVEEEALLVEYMHRTFVTCFNTMSFLMARDRTGPVQDGQSARKAVEIAVAELENTRRARALYERAPWLDLGFRLEGDFPPWNEMLVAKEKILLGIIGTQNMA
ncbi:MAG: hypothetical protein JW839_10325 [Candidatus Lokiarchaeota archaeon]|nr:hypothetical protein [Candidatus Lokiarchaeota archaeon]